MALVFTTLMDRTTKLGLIVHPISRDGYLRLAGEDFSREINSASEWDQVLTNLEGAANKPSTSDWLGHVESSAAGVMCRLDKIPSWGR